MERTIRITGKGKIDIQPDQVVFSLTQTNKKKTYDEAYQEATFAKNELDETARSIGLDPKGIKTTHFSVNEEYESYRQGDEWKRRFVGYSYNHEMTLKMDLDQELISSWMKAISKMKYAPEYNMRYTVKDQEGMKEVLIAEAVKDSQRKALALTQALNVKLGQVVNIDYSWVQVDIRSRSYDMVECDTMMAPKMMANMAMEPEDITLEDSVTVIWAIE